MKTIDCAGSFSKYSSGDYKKCRESIELWLLRYQTTGTLSDPAALLTNDPTPGSLHHCHTPAEQISASNSHCWHHPRTENENKFACCLEPFARARPTPCCSFIHGTELGKKKLEKQTKNKQTDPMLIEEAETTFCDYDQ